MANRAFRRMLRQRSQALGYSSPIIDRYEEKAEKIEQEAKEHIEHVEVPEKNTLENSHRATLDKLRLVWHNYKELFDLRIESDDERYEELFEYHKTIEKILSENG